MVIKTIYLLLIVLIGNSSLLAAEDINVEASAPSNVAVGERFRVAFSVNTRPSSFNAPAFSGFRLISGPSQSTSSSVQIINGNMTQTQTTTYTYVLEAIDEGRFTIGSAVVKYNNNEYRSKPVQVNVVKGSAAPSTAPPSQRQQQQQETTGISSNDLYIRAYASNTNPYQGEQVIINYKIYTRVNVAQYSFEKIPSFQGFWTEEIDVGQGRQAQTEYINGVQYRVAEVRRIVAFPQRSGELTIEPLEIECVVQIPSQRRRGSLIDEFFGGSMFGQYETRRIPIRSNPVKLNVKPLPTQNRPAGFTGLVGSFDISAKLSPHELNVNDAANLTITISGNGNIRMIEEPAVQLPQNLDSFDPNVKDNIQRGMNGISGSREFDFLLIPRTGGDYKIPPVVLSYFDPSAGKYVSKQTSEFNLNVLGRGIASEDARTRGREDVSLLSDEIRFIFTNPITLVSKDRIFYASKQFYILLTIPIILFIALLIYRRRHIKLNSNQALVRNRKAQRIATRKLKTASIHLKNKEQTQFYEEISHALWGYVADKLNMPLSKLNKDNIDTSFREKGLQDELASQFLQTLDECDFARFAPGDPQTIMEDVFEKAEKTIINIEKDLKNK